MNGNTDATVAKISANNTFTLRRLKILEPVATTLRHTALIGHYKVNAEMSNGTPTPK